MSLSVVTIQSLAGLARLEFAIRERAVIGEQR